MRKDLNLIEPRSGLRLIDNDTAHSETTTTPTGGVANHIPRAQVPWLIGIGFANLCLTIIIGYMSKIVGYMVTWTTYGSWLPGDERGYVRCGEILDGNKELLEKNKERQKNDSVKLSKEEKEIVKDTIIKEAERVGQTVEEITVCSSHIHLLLRPNSESIENAVSRYKSISTRALWKVGRKGQVWTKRFHKSFCFDENSIIQKIKYIAKHND